MPGQRGASSYTVPVKKITEAVRSVPGAAVVRDVKELMGEDEPLQAVVVVNEDREPMGLIMSHHMDRTLSHQYGVALFYQKTVAHIMDENPLVVDGDMPVEIVAMQAMQRDKYHIYDHVVVTVDGLVAGIVTVKRITDTLATMQQGRAAELGEINRSLEREVAERKAMQRDLEVAKHAAEEASRSKSEFLANMSHEIRTPMNAIIGMSEIVLGTELNPKQREFVNIVRTSANSLLGLINDILDFSKIEAGKLEMESIPFNLRDLVEELPDIFRAKVAESGVEMVVERGPGVPVSAVGDPLRLKQVLTNLTSNAFKFTETGEVHLKVELLEENDEGTLLRFAVRDTGIGIKPEVQNRLFSAFTQADGSTTRKYGGTGLGLVISKKLTEMMGGEIGIESDYGHGATFFFTARFGRLTERDRDELLFAEDVTAKPALVVEDNQTSRVVLQAILEGHGLDSVAVASGTEALKLLTAEPDRFGLVFMDWMLGDIDGVEVCRRLKDQGLNTPPVIVMTAFGHHEADDYADLGVRAFLMKPPKTLHLYNEVMEVFGHEPVVYTYERHMAPRGEDLHSLKVLLAEDNVINQQVALEVLQSAGVEVTVAANGREALEALRQAEFDLVLMDVQMPEMDGFEATQAIRELPDTRRLPIIAMTANAMSGDRERCLEAGMNDYVSKPIDRKHLYDTLRKWDPREAQAREEARQMVREGAARAEKAAASPTAASGPLPEDQVPASMPGIEVAEGLSRLGGKAKLFRKVLGIFADNFSGAIADIKAAREAEDAELHRRLVHTLAGAAGNVSAMRLRGLAKDMEQLIVEGDLDAAEAGMPALEAELDLVLSGIKALQAGEAMPTQTQAEPESEPAPEPQTSPWDDALMGLHKAILNRDIHQSKAILAGLQEMDMGREAQALVDELYVQLSLYDFAEAAKLLRDLGAVVSGGDRLPTPPA